MELTKEVFNKVSIALESGHIEHCKVTVVKEDGVKISEGCHNETCMCGDDKKAIALEISHITDIVWTPQLRQNYKDFKAAQEAELKIILPSDPEV